MEFIMNRLGIKVAFLILVLGVVFNIERFDVDQQSLLNMDSFIYILITLGALLPFFIRLHWKYASAVLFSIVLSLYFSYKVLLSHGHPLLGNINTYITICEVAFLLLITSIAQSIAKELRLFQEHSDILLEPGFDSESSALKRIDIEMVRSRRHERNLGIILITADSIPVSYAKSGTETL
jgi:hypothetical protein